MDDSQKPQIMMVEDNPADVFLIRRALNLADIDAVLHLAENGEQAIEYFDRMEANPAIPPLDLILLDINLPGMKGSNVIQNLRSRERSGQTRVLVVSSSDSPLDQEEMTRFGASGYFRKVSDFEEFMKLGQAVRDLLAQKSQG